MGKHIQLEVDEQDYEQLKELKDEHGVTWFGMLRNGAIHLDKCQDSLAEITTDDQ